jgi:hypothetical protein
MGDLLDPLWASTLDRIEIDLPRHSLVIEAHALDKGTTSHYRLECSGITDFHYANEDLNVEPWDYTEISEAELAKSADDRLQVRLELWAPDNEVWITAADVQLRIVDGP